MRNLHVISTVNPAMGGPIEGLKQIAAVLVRQGHHIEVACMDDPAAPWLKDFPLPVHALGPGRTSYEYAPDLIPWLKDNVGRFDAVVVNGLWQYNSFAVWRVLRHGPVPYFVFTHGMLDPWFNKAYPLKMLKKYLFWFWGMYPALRDAKGVLFNSEEERRLARNSFRPYRVNEIVVKYGTSGPTEEPDPEEFYKVCPEVQGKRFLIYLSRIHEKKGCDLLVEAFAKEAGPEDWLVMAGPDKTNLTPSLKELAKRLGVQDRVAWPGMLSGAVKWGAYAAAEAFVLPSHQENFGIVVAEALACSTPVLISNKVNIWREIEGVGAGFVDDDTLEGTARSLKKWLALSDEDKQAMRNRARACFEEFFHIDKAAESVLVATRCGRDIP